jgi:hypothetical protein
VSGRGPSVVTVAAIPVLLGLVGNLAAGTVKIPDAARPSVWMLTGMLAVAVIINEARRQNAELRSPDLEGQRLDAAADAFATAVGTLWQREERHRKITDPVALPVRWHGAPAHLVDHWANICRAPIGSTPESIDLNGQLDQIIEIYQKIPSGRLVILGAGGAGKTVLATRLALGLLANRAPGGRVPVVVGISSWDPQHPLTEWLASAMARDYPSLAQRHAGASQAAELIAAGRILPILDGFDEINPGLHEAAIRALNMLADLPLVITCRPGQYRAAVEATDVLTAAAAIELQDLTLDDLTAYLPRTARPTRQTHSGQWHSVLTHLRERPADPAAIALTKALASPLMVYLARTIYSDTPHRTPAELLDACRFPTRHAVEMHLLSSYLPAVFEHPSAKGHRWKPGDAHQWLAYLARHLDAIHSIDLTWWQLRDTIPRPTRVLVAGVVLGLIGGTTIGLLLGIVYGSVVGAVAGLNFGLFFAFVGGLVLGLPRHSPTPAATRLQIRGREGKVALGLTMGLALGLATGFMFGPTSGIGVGFVAGIAFGVRAMERPFDSKAAAGFSYSRAAGRLSWIRNTALIGLVFFLAVYMVFVIPFVLGGAWGHWLFITRTWLPLSRRMPWRMITFLTDAYDRGVLRQNGTAYQFRHALLQEYLAGRPMGIPPDDLHQAGEAVLPVAASMP